ncbi:uncharacterized protein PADG_11635 [Paracoccidioides brasiliensis Pb18]|uniref:Uncharacterized protein n=1 Tax=Paracoccidioides brasiliensis (strain Pb18) TaxID=502780 RepID=A0A0A0HXH2_PARBD|nr:uncharacterized protein PADG_11635 [Paracoccidioides brasiliensis Pb18]KGM92105.1 hypothetical protein PADG_11635 [Paracoccidioides brasiliensis Pb18]
MVEPLYLERVWEKFERFNAPEPGKPRERNRGETQREQGLWTNEDPVPPGLSTYTGLQFVYFTLMPFTLMAPFLPAELILHILQHVPDVPSLFSAILTCKHIYAVFEAHKDHIMESLSQNEWGDTQLYRHVNEGLRPNVPWSGCKGEREARRVLTGFHGQHYRFLQRDHQMVLCGHMATVSIDQC